MKRAGHGAGHCPKWVRVILTSQVLYRVAAKGLTQEMDKWAERAVQSCTAHLANYPISRVDFLQPLGSVG